jgi:hypothetical protein
VAIMGRPTYRGEVLFRRSRKQPTYLITAAPKAIADDQAVRVRGYVISMSMRLAFFLAAIVVHGWLRWVLIVCAVFLPTFAVVFANGGREPTRHQDDHLIGDAARHLP